MPLIALLVYKTQFTGYGWQFSIHFLSDFMHEKVVLIDLNALEVRLQLVPIVGFNSLAIRDNRFMK